MANLEGAPAVPAEQKNEGSSTASKPVRKARVSRPERPSREELNKNITEVNEKVAECTKRIQEIKESIDNQKQGKQGYEQEIQEAKRQLAATIAQTRTVLDQKKALREQLAAADEARKRMRDEARALRDRLPYVKVEQIDEEIKKLEYRMAHTSLSIQEEKKAVQQIRDLGKAKDFVKEYTERMDRISADENSRSNFLGKIKEKDDVINVMKAQEAQQKAAIDALWAKSRAKSTDIPTLIAEREGKYAELKQLREQIKLLHVEFREKENAYWEKEKDWRAQQAEDKKKAYEEREAYRKEKEEKRKAWEAENFVEPYTDEIIICDQLISYVEKLGAPAGGNENQGGTEKVAVAAEGFGKMVVSKKNRGDEELDSFFGGGGKKKGKKGKKEKGERFVSHSLDALTSFGKIKVTPPTSTSSEELDASLAKIKEKKEEYVKLQAVEREKRAAGAKEPEKPAVETTDEGKSGGPEVEAGDGAEETKAADDVVAEKGGEEKAGEGIITATQEDKVDEGSEETAKENGKDEGETV